MTLLEKAAAAAEAEIKQHWLDQSPIDHKRIAEAVLRSVLVPTHAMVNRGGVKAFSGPQPEGAPPMIYPALIWREMLTFVIEEGDRERPDEAGPEGEGEGGSEREVLRDDADARPGDQADGAGPDSQRGEA